MLKLKKIAITGGVASGKTSVCQFFREFGAFVVNADAIIHELLVPDTELGKEIIRQIGHDIVKQGSIDRKALADKVFTNPEQLKRLEKLLHPVLFQRIEEQYVNACQSGMYTLFVVEMPLLFEIQQESFYDDTIAVLADEAIARRRFERAGFKPADYDYRMSRQLSPRQKVARAHYTIQNNGSLEDLKKEVFALNQTIMKQP